MLAGDWDTCVAMARDQVKEGAHVLDVCVDYTGADGVADMTEVAIRFATQATLPLMVDSTEAAGDRGRPAVDRRRAHPQLGQPRGGRRARAPGSTRSSRWPASTAPPSSAPASTPRARPARPTGRCGRPAPSTTSPSTATASSPRTSSSTRWCCPCRPGMEESRRDGIETIEGIRRIKAELPGVFTIVGLSNVSFGLNPAARHVLNSMFLHECVAGRPRRRHRPRGPHHARCPRSTSAPREVCLDLIYDRRTDGYDPLQELLAAVRRRLGARPSTEEDRSGLDRRAPARAAHHRRRPQRARGRPGRGPGGGLRRARHRQRLPPGRHEDGRRALRLGRDAAALRAPVGRDHEGGRRLPRAPHGEGRPGRQGHASCSPRSRATCTTSARTWSTSSSPTTATRS